MWGGRFAEGPAAVMREINASIAFDKALWRQDIRASQAHAAMLAATGILSADEGEAIRAGLQTIAAEFERDGVPVDPALEDIHMTVEARLTELIGPVAGKLHTARSRNDQVATDFRLWVRDAVDEARAAIAMLAAALTDRADEHADSVMPGFTHLQSAQPVTLGHHLMAYQAMLARDHRRFGDMRAAMNACPLGSAALAGTGFAIDREATARALDFDAPTANSIDGVSDRDFALDYLHAASTCALHLSRLAEEIVLWASQPFGFAVLSDQWSTGSSIMPQKRNPDAAELVRAHAGRIIGLEVGLKVVMKGLPLAYAKDMQDDKPPVFEAHGLLMLSLAAMHGMIATTGFDAARMRDAAAGGHSTATDLADWLVRELGMPFREAHHVTGRIVALADTRRSSLAELPLEVLRSVHPAIDERCRSVLGLDASVASRTSAGGTAPVRVREAIAAARAEMESW